jgi:signal transduction histidine kinase/DNA-binding response OmpR family regulator
MASNDESALGAMQVLEQAGRKIPQDVAVIGFDNRLEGAVHEPALSSVHVPLFNIGYRAVDLLLRHIEGKTELDKKVKVETNLVVRESCGCKFKKVVSAQIEPEQPGHLLNAEELSAKLAKSMTLSIMNQAHHLKENEGESFCQSLVDTFIFSIQNGDRSSFERTLEEILIRTAAREDDAHIWQDAISIIENGCCESLAINSSTASLANDILNKAREIISAQMQSQHRQYVINERWTSSRLSLLTAKLLSALDEPHIYEILAKHLPDMDIYFAMLGFIEAEGPDSNAWSSLRNVVFPEQELVRFKTQEFPPVGLFNKDIPFNLTLIPLINQTGQQGFMVFGTEHFDRYGTVVQQVGGALNTARLYRQVTEGRRLAEEANRMKSRFLSSVSHELRTPLNLIVGLSGMVLRASEEGDTPLPEPTYKDIERIHTYSQHLGGLIGDVLDLATSDAGQLRLNLDFIELGQSLILIAESGRQLATDKGLEWEAILPESGPWVWGDQTRLRQVALNLINNAIKYTERGRVSLRLETKPDSVTVKVSDTGLGILPEEQQKIFDEFYQSERSVTLGYGGLGLGLAISKRLIEMHGGTIGVLSSGKRGDGSTFYFTLPTVKSPAVQVKHLIALPKKEFCVMILTNHPESSERLCLQLSERGFRVQVALMDSSYAWQTQIFESLPDAVLLDVSIASDLGWSVLKTIKDSQSAKKIPVLFYKSSQDDGSIMELDYLTKPIELAELTRALDLQWLMAEGNRSVRTILVVDDEPNTLDMHARIVQSHSSSNHVLKAHNGREALEILKREIIDLVLLDLQMPEMDGFGVLEEMHASDSLSKIPVIVVTGKVLTEADMARLNRGVAAVLGKGLFSLDETVAHISAALEHKRRLSEEAQRLVRKAMAFIHENYARSISRRDIAQHVSIAEDHLTFCFRQELRTTPIEYLQRYRINQAIRLIKDSDRAITEIALDVGFSDSGYFSRIFRRVTGMSPEAYRRS